MNPKVDQLLGCMECDNTLFELICIGTNAFDLTCSECGLVILTVQNDKAFGRDLHAPDNALKN